MAITITIVEDNNAIRRSMLGILEGAPGCKCVGSFSSGEEALSEIPKLKPQVVLMDISLPGISGIECAHELKGILPAIQIIMLTVHDDSERVFRSLRPK